MAIGDIPQLNELNVLVTFGEAQVNQGPQFIDVDVTFSHSTNDFDGGRLSLKGALAEDVLSVNHEGLGGGQIGNVGGVISSSGVPIGTMTGGAGSELVITFNAAANASAIEALIENLTYANTSNTPTASRNLVLNITDGAGLDMIEASFDPNPSPDGTHPMTGFDAGARVAPSFYDVDGDGDLDMVVVDETAGIRVFDNNDADTDFTEVFGAANPFLARSVGTRNSLDFADFDGDGDADLVIGELSGGLRYFENNNANTGFTERTGAANPFDGLLGPSFDGAYPVGMDLDEDGDIDLAVAGSNSVLRVFDNNDADTGFTELLGATNPLFGVNGIQSINFADLDADGDRDMIYQGGIIVGSLSSLENNDADAGFSPYTILGGPFVGITLVAYAETAFIDFDEDGDMDMVAGQIGTGTLAWFENTLTAAPAITVEVTPFNNAPVLSSFSGSVTFHENDANARGQLLFADVIFGDAEGNFDGAVLTLFGGLDEDILSVRDQGTGTGEVGNTGGVISYQGVVIGAMTGGAGSPLRIVFDANATTAGIKAILENLTYANTSDTPTGSRKLALTFQDGGGASLDGPFPYYNGFVGGFHPISDMSIGPRAAPTFVDLDGDGDLDLVVGNDAGTMRVFAQLDTGAFEERLGAANPFDGIDFGKLTVPRFVDLDGDGDRDLVVGDSNGTVRAFGNNDADNGFTELTGFEDPFGAISAGSGASVPSFTDLDGDGDLDLVLGEEDGSLTAYVFGVPQTIIVNVTPQLELPRLDGFGPDVTLVENEVNAAPQLLDADVTFTDADNDFDGGTLTLTGGLVEDTFGLRSGGPVSETDGTVRYGGTTIGVMTTGTGGHGTGLTITFNTDATAPMIEALIENLTYTNASDTPTASRTLLLNVKDASGASIVTPTPSFAAAPSGGAPLPDFFGNGARGLDIADLNGDGTLQMIANTFAISAGNNTFVYRVVLDKFLEYSGVLNPFAGLPATQRLMPTFEDIDADGDLDVVMGDLLGNLRVFEYDVTTSGWFTEQTGANNPLNGVTVADRAAPTFGDLDNDGDADLLVGSGSGTLRLFQNDGAGGYVELTGTANPFGGFSFEHPTLEEFTAPKLIDLDADGDLDLVVGDTAGSFRSFQNQGGQFIEWTGGDNPFAGIIPGRVSSPVFADMDGDGDLDFVAVSGLNVEWHENTTAQPGQSFDLHIAPSNDAPALAGVIGDMSFDENTVNAAAQLLNFAATVSDPDGDYAHSRITLTGILPEDIVTLRDQGMGLGEVSISGGVIHFSGVSVAVATGGDGTDLSIDFGANVTPEAVAAVIANLTYANTSNAPTATRDFTLQFYDGDGAPAVPFGPQTGTRDPFDGVDVATGSNIALFDVNGDGHLDLVTSPFGSSNLVYDINAGVTPMPQPHQLSNAFLGALAKVSFGDIDGDGDLDFLAGVSNGQIKVHTNPGAGGNFSTAVFIPNLDVGSNAGVAAADFDGDGDSDLLVVDAVGVLRLYDNDDNSEAFYLSADSSSPGDFDLILSGAINPFASITIRPGAIPHMFDLDGDGDLDMVALGAGGGIRVFDNTDGNPFFAELTGTDNWLDAIETTDITSIGFADFDGDGLADLVADMASGGFQYFKNSGVAGRVATITVAAQNDAPVLSGVAGAVTFEENIINAAPQLLDADVSFDDPDASFGAGTLTITGALTDDRISLHHQGHGEGQVGLSGVIVSYGGVEVGTLTGGAGSSLTITFNAGTAPQAVDAIVENLTFGTSSDTPKAERRLTLTLTDEGGEQAVATMDVTVTGQSDSPALTDMDAAHSLDENDVNRAPQLLDTDVTLTDPGDNFDGGTLTLTGVLAEDILSVRSQGTGAGQVQNTSGTIAFEGTSIGTLTGGDGTDLAITFNASATVSTIEAVIENLTYANASDAPTASRDLVLNVTDAEGLSIMPLKSTYVQRGSAQLGGVDFVFNSAPSFVDADDDGDIDVIVGSLTRHLVLFENNDFDDRFTLDNAPGGFLRQSIDGDKPTFADIDGDGDQDLILGAPSGGLRLFDNDDADTGFTELTGLNNPFDTFGVAADSAPTFGDMDDDGDLDLVIGALDGQLSFFENTDAGYVQRTATDNPFHGFDVGDNSAPAFGDVDGDGDLDLVVGQLDSTITTFENTATGFVSGGINPFTAIGIPGFRSLSAPGFMDVDEDGDLDLIIGDQNGLLSVVENVTPQGQVIRIDVTPQDDAPVIVSNGGAETAAIDLPENQRLVTTVLATDLDAGASVIYAITGGGDAALFMLDGTNGELSFRAAPDHEDPLDVGSDNAYEVIVEASDGALTDSQSITVLVTDSPFGVTITGSAGDDTISPSTTVEGQDVATNEADEIYGCAGVDTIVSIGGNDTLDGGPGADSLNGGSGNDSIDGGDGNDTVVGGGGDDTLGGGPGDDSLNGGTGRDSIEGGDGNDTIDGSFGADQALSGGIGNDLIIGGGGTDLLIGGGDNDTLNGDANPDTLLGGSGDDRLFGQIGRDSLVGGSGKDYLSGANAADTLEGGDGDDTLMGQGGSDAIYGDAGADVLHGGASADAIWGGSGNDSLNGGAFNDSLLGEDGNDTLIGGSGLDTANGGDGHDFIDGGSSRDTLLGGAGDDTIIGGIGNDSLNGGSEQDSLMGGAAKDTLDGGVGADVVFGGSGSDLIFVRAGQGGDTLFGEGGLDVFDFESGFGTATIADFTGQDTIDLVGVATAAKFSDLSITYSTDALIDLGGGDTLTLTGISGGLSAGDFMFA